MPPDTHTAARSVEPCLFCGKEQDADSFYYNGPGPPPSYAVECGWCGARGSCGTGRRRDDHEGARDEAVKIWNEAHAAAERRGAEVEREACLLAVEGERLTDDTGEPEDDAYNQAVDDALNAIRARAATTEGEGE